MLRGDKLLQKKSRKPNPSKILVVDDDMQLREAIVDTLALTGYTCYQAGNGAQALASLQRRSVDMVIADIQMEGMDGHTLLRSIHDKYPHIPVLLMTAYANIDGAVKAMREGAINYLPKPFSPEVLLAQVSRYTPVRRISKGEPIWADKSTGELLQMALKVAKTDATVMITGPSGSGKEVLSRYVHENSSRAEKPFVAINCAAIPDTMLEATLFGYEKGAFTGAFQACPGKFEQANGGTILLDEITEMDLGLQAKLLRVLQEREVERLGSQKTIQLDVRVIATSNRDLKQAVYERKFREDLYYRLNVFPLRWLPLNKRKGDILPLAKFFLQRYSVTIGHTIPELTKEAQNTLYNYGWPGNVRELENVMQRALILCNGDAIQVADLVLDANSDSFNPVVNQSASYHDDERKRVNRAPLPPGVLPDDVQMGPYGQQQQPQQPQGMMAYGAGVPAGQGMQGMQQGYPQATGNSFVQMPPAPPAPPTPPVPPAPTSSAYVSHATQLPTAPQVPTAPQMPVAPQSPAANQTTAAAATAAAHAGATAVAASAQGTAATAPVAPQPPQMPVGVAVPTRPQVPPRPQMPVRPAAVGAHYGSAPVSGSHSLTQSPVQGVAPHAAPQGPAASASASTATPLVSRRPLPTQTPAGGRQALPPDGTEAQAYAPLEDNKAEDKAKNSTEVTSEIDHSVDMSHVLSGGAPNIGMVPTLPGMGAMTMPVMGVPGVPAGTTYIQSAPQPQASASTHEQAVANMAAAAAAMAAAAGGGQKPLVTPLSPGDFARVMNAANAAALSVVGTQSNNLLKTDDDNASLNSKLKKHEYKMILDALMEFDGSRVKVANKLGISPRTLRYKLAAMKEEGIIIPDKFGRIVVNSTSEDDSDD